MFQACVPYEINSRPVKLVDPGLHKNKTVKIDIGAVLIDDRLVRRRLERCKLKRFVIPAC